MNKYASTSESGKSVIEMAIVLVIAGILVTFAVIQLGNSQNNLKRQNIARELKVSLERARFDSVKRRPSLESEMSRVVINSASSFTVRTDLNQNGTLDASDFREVNFSSTTTRIVGSNLTFPLYISFNRFGQIIVRNSAGTLISMPDLTLCDNCTLATANESNANTIVVSPTGTVAMLPGIQTQASVKNPNVTSVDENLQIKCSVTVSDEPCDSSNTTSTPAPTATPTPSPTPSPGPSVTPTPTPTPTSNPTPLPVCTRNQKPTQDQCICQSPMSVRSNGKCQ
jgi:Tfp pilus assembly protein FimT